MIIIVAARCIFCASGYKTLFGKNDNSAFNIGRWLLPVVHAASQTLAIWPVNRGVESFATSASGS